MDADTGVRSDEQLMLDFQAGHSTAFELLFARHRRSLFTFLSHHLGCRAQAEDAFQETFLRVVRHRSQFRPSRSFRTWLHTIALNVAVDQRRRGALRSAEVLATEPNARPLDSDPQRLASASELEARILDALGRLPEEQRAVFLLRERAGLEYSEIAEAAGCSASTARSRMRYALSALRQLLGGRVDAPSESCHG